jgi:hypothetical protein
MEAKLCPKKATRNGQNSRRGQGACGRSDCRHPRRAHFVSERISPNIPSAKIFGDTHPLAPNETKRGRAENRRIEIVVEDPGA